MGDNDQFDDFDDQMVEFDASEEVAPILDENAKRRVLFSLGSSSASKPDSSAPVVQELRDQSSQMLHGFLNRADKKREKKQQQKEDIAREKKKAEEFALKQRIKELETATNNKSKKEETSSQKKEEEKATTVEEDEEFWDDTFMEETEREAAMFSKSPAELAREEQEQKKRDARVEELAQAAIAMNATVDLRRFQPKDSQFGLNDQSASSSKKKMAQSKDKKDAIDSDDEEDEGEQQQQEDDWQQVDLELPDNIVSSAFISAENEESDDNGKKKKSAKPKQRRATQLEMQIAAEEHHQGAQIQIQHLASCSPLCDDAMVQAMILSCIPMELHPSSASSASASPSASAASSSVLASVTKPQIQALIEWFSNWALLDLEKPNLPNRSNETLVDSIDSHYVNAEELAILVVAAFRAFGCGARLVTSLTPPSHKPVLTASAPSSAAKAKRGKAAPKKRVSKKQKKEESEVESEAEEEEEKEVQPKKGGKKKTQPAAKGKQASPKKKKGAAAKTKSTKKKQQKEEAEEDVIDLDTSSSEEESENYESEQNSNSKRTRKSPQKGQSSASAAAASSSSSSSSSSSAAPISSSSKPDEKMDPGYDKCPPFWAEIWTTESSSSSSSSSAPKTSGRWMHVDPVRRLIDTPDSIEVHGHQIIYVIAAESLPLRPRLRDVTLRYASRSSDALLRRPSDWEDWWPRLLSIMTLPLIANTPNVAQLTFSAAQEEDMSQRDALEDAELKQRMQAEPLPSNQAAYKNHPYFAMDRWLTRYQAIYPREPILGYCAGQPVFPRQHVHVLHTKERWVKDEAKQVKEGEKPFKTIKMRSQTGRQGGETELFGLWQTEKYRPPAVSADGKVPKNERGNWDVWNPSCVPIGAVHLRGLPRAKQLAKKLEIDFAEAMTGFEIHGGRSVPVYDGIIVAAEFEDVLKEAHLEADKKRVETMQAKRDKAVYGRWKKLIRGLLVRESVHAKHGARVEQSDLANQTQKLAEGKVISSSSSSSSAAAATTMEDPEVIDSDGDGEQEEEEEEAATAKTVQKVLLKNGLVVEMEEL